MWKRNTKYNFALITKTRDRVILDYVYQKDDPLTWSSDAILFAGTRKWAH